MFQRIQPAPRGDSTLRHPFQRHVSFVSVPGGKTATTGDLAFGAKRSVSAAVPEATAAPPAAGASVTDTFVFSVEALSAETKVNFTGSAFVLAYLFVRKS